LLTNRFDSFLDDITYTVKNKITKLNEITGDYEEIDVNEIITESHELLEHATLAELLSLIDFISRYYYNLREIICPISTNIITHGNTTMITSYSKLSGKYLNPKQCGIFRFTSKLSKLYVYGGSIGAKGMMM